MLRTDFDHDRLGPELRRYFLDQLSPKESEAFRAHVRDCTSCRAEYEKWSAVERGLFAGSGPVSPLGFDRIAREVIPNRAESAVRVPLPRAWYARPSVLALASAATILVAGRFFLAESMEPEAFIARGVETPLGADLSVRAVVARPGAEGEAPRVFDLGSEDEALEVGDRVQIRLTHGMEGFVRVFAARDGEVRPLGPAEALPPAGEDVALPRLYSVEAWLHSGEVRLVVVVASKADLLDAAPAPSAFDEPGRRARVIFGRVR